MVSSCCFVILVWRRVMSVGCFALNGYAMVRSTNTYSWSLFLRSSSSRSARSASSFSLTSDGLGLDGLARLLERDWDTPLATLSVSPATEGDKLRVTLTLRGSSRLLPPPLPLAAAATAATDDDRIVASELSSSTVSLSLPPSSSDEDGSSMLETGPRAQLGTRRGPSQHPRVCGTH
uniref:Putative secreted protein n=1 Tax=Ixodes ricinus TaxID=34613 RepID=A0A6B0UZN7_IXORI